MTTVRTATLPEEQRPLEQGTDLVTAFREHGGSGEYPLVVAKGTYTIGSAPDCDVIIPNRFVSSLHCLLERRGRNLRVHDQSSRNGTFRAGVRDTAFDIMPGDKFAVASTTLLALDDEMRLARPAVAHVLGYDRAALVDDVLIAAIRDWPLLVTGPNGTGHEHLAQAIHRASPRRRQALIEASELPASREEQKRLLNSARRGTLALGLKGAPVDQTFLDMALSPALQVRLVVLAPHLVPSGKAPPIVDGLVHMQRIEIRPLRDREHELGRIIDHVFLELRETLRFADLASENQRGLRAYDWPGNLDELGEVVSRVTQVVRAGSFRKASQILDMPRTSLQYALERVGLRPPLTRSGFSIDEPPNRKKRRARARE